MKQFMCPEWQRKWEEFQLKPESERGRLFMPNGQLKSVICAQQFDREFMGRLFVLANGIRKIEDTKVGADYLRGLLSDKRAMLHFAQPSTRTQMSFEAACMLLGMQHSHINDVSLSSEFKGETPLDTFQTLSEYFHILITRNGEKGFAEKIAWHLNANTRRRVPVINAGSGPDQHPTQALLDLYTIFRRCGTLDELTISFIGDNARGRTVRSLAYLAKEMVNPRLIFCSPKAFTIKSDILEFLDRHCIPYLITEDMNQAVTQADVVYLTRIQDEHDKGSEVASKPFYEDFCFLPKHLEILKPKAIVMHPLPRREELAAACDVDNRVVIWRQVRNGMWIRAALMVMIFSKEEKVRQDFPKEFPD